MYCVCLFSPSDELVIFVTTDCSVVKMTSYCLNRNLEAIWSAKGKKNF